MGLFLAAPVTLVTSVVYACLMLLVFTRWPVAKKVIVALSFEILALVLIEATLLALLGAKATYAHLGRVYTALHFANFFLAPPAIANLVFWAITKKERMKWLGVAMSCSSCWVACMAALLANIVIDEAIVGVDASKPFYMTKTEPNQSLEPTTLLGTSAAEQPLVPSSVVAHL